MEQAGAKKLKALQDEARRNGYKIIGLTASGDDVKQRIKEAYGIDFEFYLCDEKALKTVVRSNPGIIELDKGTIKQKVHWNDLDDLKLPKVERAPEPIKVENIAYFIDGNISNKAEVEALDTATIEAVNVFKDSHAELDSINMASGNSFTSLVKVILKKE